MVRSCRNPSFRFTNGRPSSATAFAFVIALIAVSIVSSEGTRDGLLPELLWHVGIQHVVFRVQQRVEESHPSLADTPFVPKQSPFFVTDVLRFDLSRLLQLYQLDVLEESMPVSHAQLLLKSNDVTFEATNDFFCTSHSVQPVNCIRDGPLQLRTSSVNFPALPGFVHRISRSMQSSCLNVSTLTSLWSPSLLGWNHQISGPHNGRGEYSFHVVHAAIF